MRWLNEAKRQGIGAIAIALLMSCALGCSPKTELAKAAVKKPPTPVRVAAATQESMPVYAKNFGNAEAMMTVDVKSQVTGEMIAVSFKEGDVVQEGQVLFQIDPRPFEVALKQAEANVGKAEAEHKQAQSMLAKDKAEADNAKVELERDTTLLSRGTISKEEFDQMHTSAKSMDAVVRANEAVVQSAAESVSVARSAVDDAKLQLDYCTIRAPITGKTGSLLVHKGNLVRANDTQALVVIKQTKPIYVSFTLPEKQLPQLRDAMAGGKLVAHAFAAGDEASPSQGEITFLDNAVDQATGSIRLKATFPNSDDRLWPGQYLNVVVQLNVQADVVVVPAQAIQMGQAGPFVFVVRQDMTAELRNVKLGETVAGKTAITEGLKPGEEIVIDGQSRVSPDGAVTLAAEPEAAGTRAATANGTKPQ